VILNTFIERSKEQLDSVLIPMSCHLSIDRVRMNIEKLYMAKRKKIFVPKNSNKKIIIMIDDLHL
jgi:GTPase Era involved in 16S rRNA processing